MKFERVRILYILALILIYQTGFQTKIKAQTIAQSIKIKPVKLSSDLLDEIMDLKRGLKHSKKISLQFQTDNNNEFVTVIAIASTKKKIKIPRSNKTFILPDYLSTPKIFSNVILGDQEIIIKHLKKYIGRKTFKQGNFYFVLTPIISKEFANRLIFLIESFNASGNKIGEPRTVLMYTNPSPPKDAGAQNDDNPSTND